MRILIVKTSSLGDIVYSLPIINDILAAYPEAEIDWLVEKNFVDIPSFHRGIRRVVPIHWRYWRHHLFRKNIWEEMHQHIQVLKQEYYDFVIDTQELIKSALMCRLARSECICGHRYPKESIARIFYQKCYSIPRNIHVVDRHRWLCAAVFGYEQTPDCDFGIQLADQSINVAETFMQNHPTARGYVMIIQGASTPTKYWPIEDWQALFRWCESQALVCILPWGNSAEQQRAITLSDGHAMVYPTPTCLSISACAALIARSTLVIGQDTGFTHLAAAMGKPTIGLYLKDVIPTHGVYASQPKQKVASLGGTHCPTSQEVIDQLREWSLTGFGFGF